MPGAGTMKWETVNQSLCQRFCLSLVVEAQQDSVRDGVPFTKL